ncbi:uncharacterized protein METZ01_LOCUS516854, partial [marine metagenome]
RRLLQWAHQRYTETGLPQWKHSTKWKKYCQVCQSKEELLKDAWFWQIKTDKKN